MNLDLVCVLPTQTLRDVMRNIDRNATGIALVVDEDRHLLGTITDGDIRRGILAGVGLDDPVSAVLVHKVDPTYSKPFTAPVDTDPAGLLQLMQLHQIRHLPLLDSENRVADLVVLEKLLPEEKPVTMQAVIMAGGFGKRLRPLTDDLPKPMLQVGDRPLMERIVAQLREAGIHQVNVTTHYKPEKIVDHFGDGRAFGVDIHYVTEDRPLGTAGGLGLIETGTEPLLVINGDILTQVNFRTMAAFHREHEAELTVAVRQINVQVPFGVVEGEGPNILRIREKPTFHYLVNAGIYLLEPSAHRHIPNGVKFDMTDLIEQLISQNRKVISFPIVEYWTDIGQLGDYETAVQDVMNGRV